MPRKLQLSGATDLTSNLQCTSDSAIGTLKPKEEVDGSLPVHVPVLVPVPIPIPEMKVRCPCGNSSLHTESMIKVCVPCNPIYCNFLILIDE